MAFIELIAQTYTGPIVSSMQHDLEIRPNPECEGEELWRPILTVVLENDMENISSVVFHDEGQSTEADSIFSSFNGSDEVEIPALEGEIETEHGLAHTIFPFQLISQEFQRVEQAGTKFFRETWTWVSAGPWNDMDWV